MPEAFASEDVAKVNLNNRDGECAKGIQNGHGCVSVGASIQDQSARRIPRLLYPVNEDAFVIGLAEFDFETGFGGLLFQALLDLRERRGPIDIGLAIADKIKIWTVENEYRIHECKR